MKVKVYLDNCCFNRPYDDQSHIKIKLESEAKQCIQEKIKSNEIDLIWSYILDYENNSNPSLDKKLSIQTWENIAVQSIDESESVLEKMEMLEELGFKSLDALHISCSIVVRWDTWILLGCCAQHPNGKSPRLPRT